MARLAIPESGGWLRSRGRDWLELRLALRRSPEKFGSNAPSTRFPERRSVTGLLRVRATNAWKLTVAHADRLPRFLHRETFGSLRLSHQHGWPHVARSDQASGKMRLKGFFVDGVRVEWTRPSLRSLHGKSDCRSRQHANCSDHGQGAADRRIY
jgi:hypothetical protein